MKKYFFISAFFYFLFFAPVPVSAQSSGSTQQELVLGFPYITDKTYEDVKTILQSIDGITLAGYCENYKCFLMYYDTAKIKNGEAVTTIVAAANSSYKTEIKEGATITQLLSSCTQFPVNQIIFQSR